MTNGYLEVQVKIDVHNSLLNDTQMIIISQTSAVCLLSKLHETHRTSFLFS